MGCSSSSDKKEKSEYAQKSERFLTRVSSGEPLAKALQENFDEFMRSCADVSGGRRLRVEYSDLVEVNACVEEANKDGLTFSTAKETASDFLGYAMNELGKKNWGGKMHSDLYGAEGRSSKMKLNGEVEFDTADSTVQEPYEVALKFFCALEQ